MTARPTALVAVAASETHLWRLNRAAAAHAEQILAQAARLIQGGYQVYVTGRR
ncbi:hypothetical protein SAMN05421505_1743 [Sinosporangium album]|uniref:Uncharacterized protein n=1 Tax=Sinosporangium album TaxID=504805 RepID=A0A1G8LQW2_9ACTN|nr:hypothetical protein SAMN05421505_1743 [Sinosporangium album]